jgi:ABC-2 type transport system ATP-binding protein
MIRIKVQDINKEFQIGYKKNQSFLERIINTILRKEDKRTLKVLDNVSFEIKAGEFVGLIGKNGSGKSSLLRVLAGIYQDYEGIIETNGKIISLINISAGLKERLTMKENVYLLCSLFGLNNKEIDNKLGSIIEFSELHDFVNTKIYQFSQGMIQRLAFSIAIYSDPEILLLDEIFEVGDKSFKEKSKNKIDEMTKDGVSVLLVTHELDIISERCNRVIWFDKGKIKMDDQTKKVLESYS